MLTFSIANNSFTGSFPPTLGFTLPKLQRFLASFNQFVGSIPASLANASGLVALSIGDNNLIGPIPMNLGSLRYLEILHIARNPLGSDMTNHTIGFLISSLTNCTNLKTLSLGDIQIGGELPHSLGNLSANLNSMWLNTNNITGSIPHEISELVGLTYLAIDTNFLEGKIPDSIGKLVNLQEVYLFQNNISGEIPFSFGNITGLGALSLGENMLEGSIPISLGNWSNLQGLDLERNRLIGRIPEEIVSLSSLYLGLHLADNFLTGTLPSQVGKLEHLVDLDISENSLYGEIPGTLGHCLMLAYLKMEGNNFEGIIPSNLRNLKSIEILDLSRNNLSGEIPQFLGELEYLTKLNLSFNNFEGKVPNEGVFKNISLFSVLGNENLCGGVNQLNLPACPSEQKKSSTRRVVLLSMSISLPIIFVVVCVCALQCGIRKSKQKPSLFSMKENQYPKLSYAELLRSTDGFASANLIGKGRYGTVYKGLLNPNDQAVAIKILNLEESGANKSFLAECEALRNLRHRNLVKIITSCSSIDFQGNDFKALVFEFMPYGSLESWLYPSSSQQYHTRNLSLTQRLNVAIDVASALDYLHHHCDIPIVHCDLKPSNILLDDNFCSRVGDFGLARFLSASARNSNQTESSSIGIRGTIGYVAPEYGMGGDISTQGDLYSYGILLLEIFAGKRPTSSMFTGTISLHSYAKTALPNLVMEIVDPKIIMEGEEKFSRTSQTTDGNGISECLASILQIGVSCSAELPKDRMDIKDVLVELQRIRNVIVPVERGREEVTK